MTMMLFSTTGKRFSGMDNEKFDDYVSVDSHLATSGFNTVEELCKSHVRAVLLQGTEEEDTEPQVVPKFAEAHEALMKVKSFVYAHSNSDGDRNSVLSLENSFFELRHKVSTKQLSITEFFQKN
jgi:hypothetical protein